MQPLVTQKSLSCAETLLYAPIYIIKKLWQTISTIASTIFSCFTYMCYPKEYFNSREITLLRDERTTRNSDTSIPLTPLINRIVTVKTPSNPLLTPDAINKEEPKYNVFDDSLENLRSFTREFSVLGIDALYENLVVDHLDTAQTIAPSLPPIIKSIAKLLVEMGDKAAKPLFKKFSEQKTQTIDPALQKIFKTLLKPDLNYLREKLSALLNEDLANRNFTEGVTAADYITPLVNWISGPEEQRKPLELLQNKKLDQQLIKQLLDKAQPFWNDQIDSEKSKLYLSLEDTLREEFKNTKVPLKQTIDNDYIRPILAWLMLSNQSIPLNDIFGFVDAQKEELIDKVFERIITLLVEKKVDQYSNFLEKTIQRHLGEIIHQMMQKNAIRVSDFFSERLSELISTMSFTETVDSLIHNTFAQQIQAISISEDKREEEKQFLEKATAIARIVPNSAESLDAQIRADNHLKSVLKHGGDEAFLEHTLLEAFAKHPACNPFIRQMIEQEIQLIKQGKEPGIVRRGSEKALYTSISEKLLELMMPIRKRLGTSGEIEEIDPFVDLWERLYLPDEFYDLVKQCEELTQEFATPETTALLEKIKLPVAEIIKKTFVTIAKDKLKKQLVDIVQSAFEKITSPEKIKEINAQQSLPSLNKILVETFAKQELGRRLNEFTPLFYALVTSDSTTHDDRLLELQQALIKQVKSKFDQFNPDEFYCTAEEKNNKAELVISGLSDQDWLNISNNIISHIEQSIRHSKINKIDFNPEKTTLGEVSDIIKKTFKTEFRMNNPSFGNISMDLIFKLGKFENEWLIGFFMKDTISTNITESVEPWRQSYQKLIETTTAALNDSFLDPITVKALFSNEPSKPSLLIDEKLTHQINVAARLAYDIIIGIVNEEGIITSYATKKILKGNPEMLNKVITTIFKKLHGNRMVNQSLVINISETIFKSLAAAAENVSMVENIKAHQLEAEKTA